MNEQVCNNVYFENPTIFREAIHHFFTVTLQEKAKVLSGQFNDNFQILKPISSN
ncbi:hypothetical protein XCR1_1920050 [Xenorhabdus cabanillasii JM26]|uniref:Uncharacterized protein n=1 Tax=Xenorhabdus cabanillasii JM26 TaxID=1427517 RepID=W1J4U5_9GAMM|nr:hypothetical protein XCR1_1920050 [Xenorhabdus cabanillasii JM26]